MAERTLYTFTEIVNTIITTIGALGATLTDFTPGSNLRAIVDSFAHFVEFMQLQINIAFDSFYISTATGDNLKNRIRDLGMTEKEAVAGSTTLTFYRNTPAPSDFTILAETQVSTQPDVFGNTIDYTLDSDVVFPSGALSATGLITCTVAGFSGNVPSGYVTNMTSLISGVDSINNLEAITNGSDAETDEQIRNRFPLYLLGLQHGNEAAIVSAALSVPGISVVKAEENSPSSGYITAYVSNQTGTLTQEEIASVKQVIESKAAFGITVNIVTPTVLYVTISADLEYDSVNFAEDLIRNELRTRIYNFVQINPESKLKLKDIKNILYKMPGITNYSNVKINGMAADYEVNGFNVIRVNNPTSDITFVFTEEE